MNESEYELITVYRGKDSATYLAKDFLEFGDNAEPLWMRQNPSDNAPFVKIELKDSDGFYQHNEITKEDIEGHKGVWNTKALQKPPTPNSIERTK